MSETLAQSLAMGGYGAYVWSCFGLTLVVVVVCVVQGRRRHERVLENLRTRLVAMESES